MPQYLGAAPSARRPTARRRLIAGVALTAMSAAAAPTAWAQEGAATDSQIEEVVVTASRVVRSGFTAPTPLTVLGAEDFQKRAPTNVADVLNEAPAFRPSTTPSTNRQSTAGAGQSYADLRGLGTTRTLTLVDGRRHVPTSASGQVDLNLIPSILIDRVEVVTGGASAAWGSDAVAGVVNLILKKNLEGVQGEVQYGQSDKGDDVNYKAALAVGHRFAGGKIRFMAGGEYSNDKGAGDLTTRDWGREDWGQVSNTAFATNGIPATIYSRNVVWNDLAAGGLITAGPFRGTTFKPDGTPTPFQYGQVYGNQMIGGFNPTANQSAGNHLKNPVERYVALSHVDIDFTDSITGFLEGSYARSEVNSIGVRLLDQNNLSMRVDNAYLDPGLRAQMVAAGLTTFTMGRLNLDLGPVLPDLSNRTWRVATGLNGELGSKWKWNAYYQYGENLYDAKVLNNRVQANWLLAIDAVRSPSGAIVCRSTLASPGNGCVPFNVFGDGAPSEAAKAYVRGDQWLLQTTTEHAAAVGINGEPFSTWAGPVSLATGFEYRADKVFGTTDPIALADGYRTSNSKAVNGDVNVKEVYGEVVVPLLGGLDYAKSLDFNGAARRTDYSTSGGVTTWKLGLTWEVNDQVRLRTTRSRDIRAPNLFELYTGSVLTPLPITNPITGQRPQTFVYSVGNVDLKPEKADTFSVGAVYQPSWARRLRASVDYYNIKIDGQIAQTGGQNIVDRCFQGAAEFCKLVQYNSANAIVSITNAYLNLNSFQTAGFDVELSFGLSAASLAPQLPGDLTFRLLGTKVTKLVSVDSTGPVDRAGEVGGSGTPDWLLNGTLSYNLGRFSGAVQGRYVSGGTINNRAVPGTSTSVNINHVDARFYTNLSAQYDIHRTEDGRLIQVYGVVDNLFDVDPPFPTIAGVYHDLVGRAYRVGLRFRR